MSETVIKVENLSKLYRLGEVGTGTLSHDLNRWFAKMRGKEDPFAKVGTTNDRTQKAEKGEHVWALKDINFEVKQGEVLGIIGKNGAGKSTLLKILSRITSPTTGNIKVKGRVASLLEVGTGFHPEMTGRENVYLNGTILGMTRREIDKKFEEIMDFAGCLKYAHTPVKRYSSGMMVRLGFAVAAFLEPEILIVDEVLAVGDAEFQKKAIGKMQDISKGGGRTVLFVSHNMSSVRSLCTKGIILENGQLAFEGKAEEAITNYISQKQATNNNLIAIPRSGSGEIIISGFHIENEAGVKIETVLSGDTVVLIFTLHVKKKGLTNLDLGFSLHNIFGDRLAVLYSSYQHVIFENHLGLGKNRIECKLNNFPLSPGRVLVRARLLSKGHEVDWPKEEIGNIDIQMGDFYKTGMNGILDSTSLLIKGDWKCNSLAQ